MPVQQQIPVQSLVNQIRVESDLNSSQVFQDTDIATLISDAGSDLRDVFTSANQLYDVSTFDFTLSGGLGDTNGVNSWDLSGAPGDFQQGHSVDINPGTATPYTLKYLSNWLQRNQASSPIPFVAPGGGPRCYCFVGTKLKVFPPNNSAGNYRLYYTPMWVPLMVPQPIPPDNSGTAASILSIGPGGVFSFSRAAWTSAYVGWTFTVSGAANAQNNGTFTITSVVDSSDIIVAPTTTVSESAGATATIQQIGTTPNLPVIMNPWILYLKTLAIISIRTKRGQNVDEFNGRLMVQKDRIQSILQSRQDEAQQPPLTRGVSDFWGCGGGW